jgi:hypothetical protein
MPNLTQLPADAILLTVCIISLYVSVRVWIRHRRTTADNATALNHLDAVLSRAEKKAEKLGKLMRKLK